MCGTRDFLKRGERLVRWVRKIRYVRGEMSENRE